MERRPGDGRRSGEKKRGGEWGVVSGTAVVERVRGLHARVIHSLLINKIVLLVRFGLVWLGAAGAQLTTCLRLRSFNYR